MQLPDASQPNRAGAWAGYLIFGLFLLCLIAFDAQAAYDREWGRVVGISVVGLSGPMTAGGVKWRRRSLRARKP